VAEWNLRGSPEFEAQCLETSAELAMGLYRTGLAAMGAATCFVSVMFLYALHAPTRPAVPAWKTRVVEVDDWAKRWAEPGEAHPVTFTHPVSLVNAQH
jgi:hypothetical protein